MKIGFFLSSLGGSPLQVGLERGLVSLGHKVEYLIGQDIDPFDLVLFFNQSAHTCAYAYPDFPETINKPFAFIDNAEYGFYARTPIRIMKFWNSFTPEAMGHDTKHLGQQLRLRDWLRGRSFPYFLREFFKCMRFPGCYHPIDYPLYLYSENPVLPNRQEFLDRSLDLFVSWGESHHWRKNLSAELRLAPVRSEIHILEENGFQRMPQDQYFARMAAAKCSVCFDGYGSSSFRINEVLARCLALVGPMAIHRAFPLVDGVHCIEYQIESDGNMGFLGSNIVQKLQDALDCPERSFKIFEAGYYHNIAHYSERATAEYLLDVIAKHDWTKPTPLDNEDWNPDPSVT